MKHQNLKTTPAISKRMAHVHLKQGKAETSLAKALWHHGYRYRLNDKKLPGSPDIAITKYQIAIFVDGEFWHGYDWEHKKDKLKSNKAFWTEKIEENIQRDIRNDKLLLSSGWIPLHFWEKEVKKNLNGCVQTVQDIILQVKIQQWEDNGPLYTAPDLVDP